ncbi:MAG: hypothetical protein ABIP94_10520 [Planctomycetota bacterium]
MVLALEFLDAARHVTGTKHLLTVVHGEDDPAEAYAGRLRNAGFRSVIVPNKHDRHEIV